MSDSFEVIVKYSMNGVKKQDRYINKQIHSCVRATKRKNKGCIILNTTTRDMTYADKCIPDPEGFRFARFKVKTKKNRWGREVHIAEEMNYEPLNGDEREEEKVSIQKWS